MSDIINDRSLQQGMKASGSSTPGNPVIIGGVASSAQPTAVSAGQSINSWADLVGRNVICEWSPSSLIPTCATLTLNSDVSLIAAPGAGSLYICSVLATNSSGTLTRLDLKNGSGGTVYITGVCAASGGGFFYKPLRPVKLSSTTGLYGFLSVAVTDVRLTIEFFTEL